MRTGDRGHRGRRLGRRAFWVHAVRGWLSRWVCPGCLGPRVRRLSRIPGPEGPGMEGRPPGSPGFQARPVPLPVVSGLVLAVGLRSSRSCPGWVLAGHGRGRARRDSGRVSFDASGCPPRLCPGLSVYLYIWPLQSVYIPAWIFYGMYILLAVLFYAYITV